MDDPEETRPLVGDNIEQALDATTVLTPLPRVFNHKHVLSMTISAVLGLGFYIRTSTILSIGGPGPALLALIVLALLITASINRDIALMLRIWPINGSPVSYTRAFVDQEIGLIAGWDHWLKHWCCHGGLTVLSILLVDSLGLSKPLSTVLNAILTVNPIIINLMDSRCFKNIHLCLSIGKIIAAAVIFLILLAINPVVAQPHQDSAEDMGVVVRGSGLVEYVLATFYATFAYAYAFVGIEAVASMVSETSTERVNPPEYEEGQEIDSQYSRRRYRFAKPIMLAHILILLISASTAWIIAENNETRNDWSRPIDGHPDMSRLVFILSGGYPSERLRVWLAILLIYIGQDTSVAALHLSTRYLLVQASYLSGHRRGGADLSPFWVRLSSKSKYHVPWVAILASASLPVSITIINYIWPEAMEYILSLMMDIGSTATLRTWGLQSFTAWRFYVCLRNKHRILTGSIDEWALRYFRNPSWYQRHTAMSITTTVACLIIILGGHGASCYYNNNIWQWSSSILNVALFPIITIIAKLWSGTEFGVDLSDDQAVKRMVQSLNNELTANYQRLERPPLVGRDCFGILNLDGILDWFSGKIGHKAQ